MLIAASFTSCTASLQGASSAIISTSYSSTDEDIYAAENAYRALEEALNTQINQMESTHPDYDEYRYQIDEIGHNPYQLISYLTVKYGGFTYDEVAEEIKEIFRQQYGITTDSTRETVTETKTVRVGESLGLVVTSGYCNCPICCGQWSGGPTASGAMPTANHITIKASLDKGLTWLPENQVMLDEDEGWGYTCLTMIDRETVGILYESSVAHMTFQAIKLKDLIRE